MILDLWKKSCILTLIRKGQLESLTLFIVIIMALIGASCNNTNIDPEDTVENAMNVNEQKAKDSALPVQTSDADFIVKAANSGSAEVAMAKLAQEKAMSRDVQTFAEKMIKDHSEINIQLKNLADSLDITLPASLDEDERADLDRLKNIAANDFDKAFIDKMLKVHDKDVKLFEHASKDILTPGIHGFIVETLPVVKKHQEAIQYLDKSMD